MKLGPWVVEAHELCWRVYKAQDSGLTRTGRAKVRRPSYFSRLEHVARFVADAEAKELAKAVDSADELAQAIQQRLEEMLR